MYTGTSGAALARVDGLCRRRSAGEGFELRPFFPLIVLTTALSHGTSTGAPQGETTPPHDDATPPGKAAASETEDIAFLSDLPLIAACANPLALASIDNSSLHWAACNQDPAVLGPLIEAGADLEAWNLHGLTPLQLAAYVNPNPAVIRSLLEAGADVNARNYRGETPLHLAARNNTNSAVIQVLLDAGADISAVTDDGWTAWDLAQENSHLKGVGAHLRPR